MTAQDMRLIREELFLDKMKKQLDEDFWKC